LIQSAWLLDLSEVNNPLKILQELDRNLSDPVELILYGRGALAMAFPQLTDCMATRDVDVIIPCSDEEMFDQNLKFWEALEITNRKLEASGLYLTHLFLDEQIILSPDWRTHCMPISAPVLKNLSLLRPSAQDLILSKMMRIDPQDREDIRQLLPFAPPPAEGWTFFFKNARVPDSPELRETFQQNQIWFFAEGLDAFTR